MDLKKKRGSLGCGEATPTTKLWSQGHKSVKGLQHLRVYAFAIIRHRWKKISVSAVYRAWRVITALIGLFLFVLITKSWTTSLDDSKMVLFLYFFLHCFNIVSFILSSFLHFRTRISISFHKLPSKGIEGATDTKRWPPRRLRTWKLHYEDKQVHIMQLPCFFRRVPFCYTLTKVALSFPFLVSEWAQVVLEKCDGRLPTAQTKHKTWNSNRPELCLSQIF